MNKKIIIVSTLLLGLIVTSCKKEGCTDSSAANYSSEAKKDDGSCVYTIGRQALLQEIGQHVIVSTYSNLSSKTNELDIAVNAFIANPSANGLTQCKELWKDARQSWEQSEGFLFGPVATNDIDPSIDTWPVDYNSLDSLMQSSMDFSNDANIEGLRFALKGFHPMEYLLWGQNGNKTYTDFTSREFEFLQALSKNVKELTANLVTDWNLNSSSSYYATFTNPGSNNNTYTTNLDAYEEVVAAMAGICDEVGSGKMGEPFTLQDPSLVESPYSQNSITDFTNNINSVKNIYEGIDGNSKGLSQLVRENNLSLDNTIKAKINNAIVKLNAITDPFKQAITSQATLVQNAIDAINDLKSTIDNNLLPYVQKYVTK